MSKSMNHETTCRHATASRFPPGAGGPPRLGLGVPQEWKPGELQVGLTTALLIPMLPSGVRIPAARRWPEGLFLCRAEGEQSALSIGVSIETSFISLWRPHAKAVAESAAGEEDRTSDFLDAVTTSFSSTPTLLNLNFLHAN